MDYNGSKFFKKFKTTYVLNEQNESLTKSDEFFKKSVESISNILKDNNVSITYDIMNINNDNNTKTFSWSGTINGNIKWFYKSGYLHNNGLYISCDNILLSDKLINSLRLFTVHMNNNYISYVNEFLNNK